MQATIHSNKFDWTAAIHDEVVKSLCSSFGLDFLLFEDKVGGDVDTIHNVRQGIYATKVENDKYVNKSSYNTHDYHQDKRQSNPNNEESRYKQKNNLDGILQNEGRLYDPYMNRYLDNSKKRNLDHIISAKEIHEDAGRILAELDGVELANQSSNFNSTLEVINKSKNAKSMQEFIEYIPKKISNLESEIKTLEQKKSTIGLSEKEINRLEKFNEDVEVFKNFDKEAALKLDKEAREKYNYQVNQAYYKGSKFLGNALHTSLNSGVKMGMRQAIGLVLAEVWFELREQLPVIINQCKIKFEMSDFLIKIKVTLENIWKRVSARFQDLLVSFKDGFLGGLFASVTTTVVNIFFTTQKAMGKLIRECWQTIIQVTKLITFNPDNLAVGDLAKEVTRLIGLAVNVAIGTIVHQHLVNLISALPFGVYIASFLSALVAGILTVGFSYFLDYSEIMQKVWSYLNSLKSKYQFTLEFYQQINAELDEYLIELSKIEFNLDADELYIFSQSLASANSEYERGLVLAAEAQRRNIELPFEINNTKSGRDWLSGLSKK